MSGKFTLTINLGNDAVQGPDDIAQLLTKVAARLTGIGDHIGRITDYNGNVVGEWHLQETEQGPD